MKNIVSSIKQTKKATQNMLSPNQHIQLLRNVAHLVDRCDDYPQFSFCFESFEDDYMPEELEDCEELKDEIAEFLEKVGTNIDTILTSVCNTYRKYDALEYVDKFTFGTKEDRQKLYYDSFGGMDSTPEEEDPEDIDDEDSARWAVWDQFTTAQFKHDVLVELNRQIQELEQQSEEKTKFVPKMTIGTVVPNVQNDKNKSWGDIEDEEENNCAAEKNDDESDDEE